MLDAAPVIAPVALWKKFSANFLSYGYSQVVTLAVQFLTVPFFLHYWGSQQYAEWLVLSGIPVMLGLLDLGVSHASGSRATLLAAKGDVAGARSSLQTGLVFTLAVVTLLLGAATLTVTRVEWQQLLKLASLGSKDAGLLLLLLVAHLCINMLGGPLNSWFLAIDRASKGFFLLANRRLLDVFITVAVLASGGNALHLASSLVIAQGVLLSVLVIHAQCLTPWPALGFRNASLAELQIVWKPAAGHVGITAGQVIALQASLQLLNQVAPPTAVVVFTMTRTLMRLVLQIGVVGNHALRPELGRLLATDRTESAVRFVRLITHYSFGLAVFSYLALIALGPELIRIWGNQHVQADRTILALVGVHALLGAAWFVPAAYRMASNDHGWLAACYFAGAIIAVFLWSPLCMGLGETRAAAVLLAVPEATALLALWIDHRRAVQNRARNNEETLLDPSLSV